MITQTRTIALLILGGAAYLTVGVLVPAPWFVRALLILVGAMFLAEGIRARCERDVRIMLNLHPQDERTKHP
jgi:hypothetical protein